MSPTSYRTAPPRVKVKLPNRHPVSEWRFQIRNPKSKIRNSLVGLGRVELPTSRLSGVRSNQLSYRPIFSFASFPSAPKEISNSRFEISEECEFGRKKEPHFSSVRSVSTVDAPEGRVASVAMKTACDLLLC